MQAEAPLFADLPYRDLSFFEFFSLFFQRVIGFLSGSFSLNELASDELQILTLSGIAISCAIVGVFLVLKRMTMLANSLSHTILIGIVAAFLLFPQISHETAVGVPMEALIIASFLTGIFTTFLTQFLTKTVRLQEDASTGLVFTTLFAIGIVMVTVLTRSAHIGTEAVMGNVDALHSNDLVWAFAVCLVNSALCLIFFKEWKLEAFDSGFAKAIGFSPLFFNYLLMAEVSLTTISSFRAVGILLVLAFMTGPVLTARLFTKRLSSLLLLSCFFGVLASFVAVALSRHLLSFHGVALSTGGVVVSVILLGYLLAIGGKKISQMLNTPLEK